MSRHNLIACAKLECLCLQIHPATMISNGDFFCLCSVAACATAAKSHRYTVQAHATRPVIEAVPEPAVVRNLLGRYEGRRLKSWHAVELQKRKLYQVYPSTAKRHPTVLKLNRVAPELGSGQLYNYLVELGKGLQPKNVTLGPRPAYLGDNETLFFERISTVPHKHACSSSTSIARTRQLAVCATTVCSTLSRRHCGAICCYLSLANNQVAAVTLGPGEVSPGPQESQRSSHRLVSASTLLE